MQLTRYTDYSLRVLIYLMLRDGSPATISEIASYYDISRHHLVKVVHNLGILGLVDTMRGKGGGLRLANGTREKRLGGVVRSIEANLRLIDCGSITHDNLCTVLPVCDLPRVFNRALHRFFEELDRYRLEDIITEASSPFELPGLVQRGGSSR